MSTATTAPTRTVFHKVWLQSTPPRRSMRAYRQRQTGTLSTDLATREAVFETKRGERRTLANVRDVEMGPRGNDIVNTWIEVRFGDAATPMTLYLNDGGWFGWRALLTHSNLRIAQSLSPLRAAR